MMAFILSLPSDVGEAAVVVVAVVVVDFSIVVGLVVDVVDTIVVVSKGGENKKNE